MGGLVHKWLFSIFHPFFRLVISLRSCKLSRFFNLWCENIAGAKPPHLKYWGGYSPPSPPVPPPLLYTELTLLRKGENETTTGYIIRAETAATALKTAEEIISDGLLIAMILKGIIYHEIIKHFQPLLYKEQMTFSEFKTALRNYEENE